MKNVVVSLLAVAGLAAAAHGQAGTQGVSNIAIEVSTDNTNWSNTLPLAPNSGLVTVYTRVSVSWAANGSTQATPAGGLGQFTYQPTISQWGATDSVFPYLATGNTGVAPTTGVVVPSAANMGRLTGYSAASLTTSTAITNFIGANNPNDPGVGYLRLALAIATNWIGVGSSTTATNNASGGASVPSSQTPPGASPPPPNNPNTSNVHVFIFAVAIDTSVQRSMHVAIDPNGIGFLSSTLRPRRGAIWYSTTTTAQGDVFADTGTITNSTITISPTPASLALLGMGGLIVGRRRR